MITNRKKINEVLDMYYDGLISRHEAIMALDATEEEFKSLLRDDETIMKGGKQ